MENLDTYKQPTIWFAKRKLQLKASHTVDSGPETNRRYDSLLTSWSLCGIILVNTSHSQCTTLHHSDCAAWKWSKSKGDAKVEHFILMLGKCKVNLWGMAIKAPPHLWLISVKFSRDFVRVKLTKKVLNVCTLSS